ncbi:energy transducer TonB [uncultured Roseivirga sp.]|uniref:energy transducer TonB n=1 Tax=uncultured Roseivirga sp. TaxID=543088 RepID=UPI0030DCBBB5|tara:strand:+ start:392370 stop:393101 length:732 start_codon:yes stop_codon:yes gene_type:complete
MIRATLSLLLLLLCFTALSQEIDTVYFDQKDKVVDKNDASVFRYDVTSSKRKNSSTHKYLKDGTLIEAINLVKDERHGDYYVFNLEDSSQTTGQYKNGVKVGEWIIKDLKNGHSFIEVYDKKGLLTKKDATLSTDNRIYATTDLDIQPDYTTGQSGWNKHLLMNLKYPREAAANGTSGKVNLRLTILSDGRIVKAEVQNDKANKYLAKEAIRVALLSKNWNPGIKDGKAVNCFMDIKIVFRTN